MRDFLRDNARWLGAGLILTFGSAFGQTWFISLFAGEIRATHGLSDGGWGSLYSLATLASAGLLLARGSLADTMPLARLAALTALGFALAALTMGFAANIWMLGAAIFGLRFCGQGMFSHIAMTATGRWFQAHRGRAVGIVTLGYAAAEAFWPFPTVMAIGALGPRQTWIIVAALLALVVAPCVAALAARGRAPDRIDAGGGATVGLGGRDWTRAEALRHWLLPALLPIALTPGFIVTVTYFHQVHIAGVKGWALAAMAPGYSAFASMTVVSALSAGWASDRFGPTRLLPVALLPLGLGIALIAPAQPQPVWIWYLALGLMGLSQGLASALWGTLLPTLFGTRHLGSLRSLVTTGQVMATALGPALTGLLIDAGIVFPRQCLAMALWCLGLSFGAVFITRKLARGA